MVLLNNGQSSGNEFMDERTSFEIPYTREIRGATIRNIRKYGHVSLVMTIRLYVRSNNFLKNKYEEVKVKVKDIHYKRRIKNGSRDRQEISKFLKIISDYKHKIRKIKQRIHEEEKS